MKSSGGSTDTAAAYFEKVSLFKLPGISMKFTDGQIHPEFGCFCSVAGLFEIERLLFIFSNTLIINVILITVMTSTTMSHKLTLLLSHLPPLHIYDHNIFIFIQHD